MKKDTRIKIKGERKESAKNPTIKLKIDKTKWLETSKNYEKTALLFVTGKCNLDCSYCFNKNNLKDGYEMSMDYIKKIVKANPHITKYDIQGGEPLLRKDINEIIKYLYSEGKKVSIYTNGYLLNKLDKNHKNLKICISFQSIISKDKSLKPINDITKNLLEYQNIYSFKIIYLINRYNVGKLDEFVNYVEENFLNINKITIGLVRDEGNYFDDSAVYTIPLKVYAKIIQEFIDKYNGRLDVDIFTKGILRSPSLPKSQENQICRFKNIFANKTYVPCLYLIAKDKKLKIGENLKIPYPIHSKCKRTGRGNCLADKIYLKNIINN